MPICELLFQCESTLRLGSKSKPPQEGRWQMLLKQVNSAAAMGSLDLSFETVGLDSGFCAHREGRKIYR
jgi:hypothetical protein